MTTPLSADDLGEVAGAYRLSAAVLAMAELGLWARTDGARTVVVDMPVDDGPGSHRSATAALTAWVVYGGADRTRDQWTQLHERSGLTIERTIDLDDRFAMFVSAKATDRQRP